jgi:hypothetical protein
LPIDNIGLLIDNSGLLIVRFRKTHWEFRIADW